MATTKRGLYARREGLNRRARWRFVFRKFRSKLIGCPHFFLKKSTSTYSVLVPFGCGGVEYKYIVDRVSMFTWSQKLSRAHTHTRTSTFASKNSKISFLANSLPSLFTISVYVPCVQTSLRSLAPVPPIATNSQQPPQTLL